MLVGGLCYGAGIGTIFPIIKLMISDEGPQGAADIRLTESMMGVTLRTVVFLPNTEVDIDKVEFTQGMNITIVVNNSSDEESLQMLSLFGMPFRRN